jgi:CO dehydrogenase/acetyl-CoA synthase gamma subunit (corrinoid Fe-S protein)
LFHPTENCYISYSRPFKRSKSKDFAALSITVDLPQVFNAVEDHVSLHKRIIELRDKAVAHSDWEFHNTKLVESSPDTSLVIRKSSVVHFSTEIDLEIFITIAEAMALHCSCRSYEIDANYRKEGSP